MDTPWMERRPLSARLGTTPILPATAAAFAMVIFLVDAVTPLDVAVAVLYVVVVLLAAGFLERRGVLLVAAACLSLTAAAYLMSHGLSSGTALGRAVMSVSAIGITTFLALKNQSASLALRNQARLLDLTHDTVFVRDMNDVITYWNHGAEELYGWPKEQAVGRHCHQLMRTSFPQSLEAITAELLRSGRWEGELVHTKQDGTQVVVESRWALQRDDRGRPVEIMETNTDITRRKLADAELRKSERRYRNIFQTAGVSIWEEDYTQVKAALDELRSQGVSDLGQYLADHPDFVRQAMAMVRIVDVNDATVKMLGARTKDELSLDKVFLSETEQAFAAVVLAIAEGRTSMESETVMRTLAGDRLAVLFTVTFPPEPGRLDSVLISIMDVTERNRTQEALQQAQDQLAHVARVTTLGELTASIAHEVNQPLAAIVTNGQACLRWLGHDPPHLGEARGAVKRIVSDADRAGEVIRRVRDLSRKTVPQKARLSLNEVVNDVVLLVRREVLTHRVSLRLELAPALPSVLGDRVQLQQVIINLMINAIQAMEPVTGRPRELLIRSQTHEADQVLVAVQDSGIGIDAENLGRLFGTFFTTKPDGMGMGLSICRSIIEAHGGKIWVSRNASPGVTVQFTLPSIQENASE
jgi:PAS domain S-box-containing protein